MRTMCGTILAVAVAATTCVHGAAAGVERANVANLAGRDHLGRVYQ